MLARAMFLAVLAGATGAHAQEGPIIHDGEYNFLRAQFGERWDAQDVEIDARLSEIRDANDGKPPNIL